MKASLFSFWFFFFSLKKIWVPPTSIWRVWPQDCLSAEFVSVSKCLRVCSTGRRDVDLRQAFPFQPSVSDCGGFSQPQRTGRVTNGRSLLRNTDMKQVLMSCFPFSFLSLSLSAGHYYWWEIDWQQAYPLGGSEIFWVIAKSLQQGQLC